MNHANITVDKEESEGRTHKNGVESNAKFYEKEPEEQTFSPSLTFYSDDILPDAHIAGQRTKSVNIYCFFL
jgi:hypothetical protein